MHKITTFLMFDGQAADAVRYYVSLFPDSDILEMERYEEEELFGRVRQAVFCLSGQTFMAVDTPVTHGFGFTPAMSLFVKRDSEAEIERLYNELSNGGQVLMPLDAYPFSSKYAWLNDRFGVSWQLMFAEQAD